MSRFRRNGTCSKSGWRFRPRARRHRPRKTGERAITAPCDTKTASVRPVDATVAVAFELGAGGQEGKKEEPVKSPSSGSFGLAPLVLGCGAHVAIAAGPR